MRGNLWQPNCNKLSAPYRLHPDLRLLVNLRLTLRAPGDTLHHDIVGNRRVVAGHPVEHVIKREFGIIGRQPPQPMMSFSACASVLASTRTMFIAGSKKLCACVERCPEDTAQSTQNAVSQGNNMLGGPKGAG